MNVRNFEKKLNYNFKKLVEHDHNYIQKSSIVKEKKVNGDSVNGGCWFTEVGRR